MEHVSSVRPTGKFPEKVENLKRWPRFPGWNFRMSCSIYVSRSLYQFQVHGRAPPRTGVYDQMEQLFTNRKFHFCYHRNFRFFFVNGKRPRCHRQVTLTLPGIPSIGQYGIPRPWYFPFQKSYWFEVANKRTIAVYAQDHEQGMDLNTAGGSSMSSRHWVRDKG